MTKAEGARKPTIERVSVSHDTAASVISNPDAASLKRIAWAFGCAKKGSDEERLLRAILLERVVRETGGGS